MDTHVGAGLQDLHETARLATLRSYDILDTAAEPAFDRIVDLARTLFDAPIALVTFLDANRQWFKARAGLNVTETPREQAFCDHAIRQDGVTIVADARTDPRFAANPMVVGAPGIRFYAGAPLVTPTGARLGTVCVISPEPRAGFAERDRQRLAALAGIVANELELRLRTAQARRIAEEKDLLAREIAHRMGSSLRLVTCVLEAQASRSKDAPVRHALYEAVDRVASVEMLHGLLLRDGAAFGDDARAYLMALIGNLQEGSVDEAMGRSVALRVDGDLRLPPGSLARLGMVTTELITNALRHGDGAVRAHVRLDDGAVLISVTDEGTGFAPGRGPLVSHDRLGLRIVSMLALPSGVSIDPSCPRRIAVRIAAADWPEA